MYRTLSLCAALVLASLSMPVLDAQNAHGLTDVLTPTKGKPIPCTILEQYGDGDVIYWTKKRKAKKRSKVETIDLLRKRLGTLLEERVEGMSPQQEWQLVARATELCLPRMASVLAWHMLTLDPNHEGAHLFLGHKLKAKKWRLKLDGKEILYSKFEQAIGDWGTGLILESEHYSLHTNVGLRKSIDAIIDLERLYLGWHERLGLKLLAAEDVLYKKTDSMQVFLFRSPEDKHNDFFRTKQREPMYDPSQEFRTKQGFSNLLVTHERADNRGFDRLFDLAARQLLYSLTVANSIKSQAPRNANEHLAHWAEWGIGYWIARQTTGKPGYLTWKPFKLEPNVARIALSTAKPGPLSTVREEISNLIHLETSLFHTSGPNPVIYRAKAQAFACFLLETDHEMKRFKKKVLGHSREGFYHYLRESYGTPTGSSSSKFDEYLGDVKVETLGPAWRAWLGEQL